MIKCVNLFSVIIIGIDGDFIPVHSAVFSCNKSGFGIIFQRQIPYIFSCFLRFFLLFIFKCRKAHFEKIDLLKLPQNHSCYV